MNALTKKGAVVPGSIGAIARDSNTSIAESFVNADCVVLVDTSGSMGAHDSLNGQSRYDRACEELKDLQGSLPGKIAVLSFSSSVIFCPYGEPFFLNGSTDLTNALQFAKIADAIEGMRFIVISDGRPDDEQAAMQVASTYRNQIDVIFTGPEDRPTGREFLERLARASGGMSVTSDRVAALSDTVQLLLAAS